MDSEHIGKAYYSLLMETNRLNLLTRITVLQIRDYAIDELKRCVYPFDYSDGLKRVYPFDRVLQKGQVFRIINTTCSQRVLAIEDGPPTNALPKLYNNSIREVKETFLYALKVIREALKRLYLDNDTIGVYIDMYQTHLVQLRYLLADGSISAIRDFYR